MPTEDVERFVGLLVSDERFTQELANNFEETLALRKLNLDKKELAILKESFQAYAQPARVRPGISLGGEVAVPIAVAVAASVAGSVAGAIATKVVDKLMSSDVLSEISNPANIWLRDSLILRGLVSKEEFNIRG